MPDESTRFDWDDLKIFHALVDAGSMSAAARQLGIGQPTVSRRLDQLEKRMGARLVNRNHDGLELTETGAQIWNRVQIMQSTASDIGRIAFKADKSESGVVRLAAPDGLGGYWIARHLPSFMEANPDIVVELSTRVEGQEGPAPADISLQMTETKRMDMVAHELATLHYTPFAARQYLDTYGTPSSLVDILNHRTGDMVSYQIQQEGWSSQAKAVKDMMTPAFVTDSSASLVEAVKAGAVIAMMPTYAAHIMPNLIHLNFGLVVPIQLWMVYHPDQGDIVRVKKLMSWLGEIFDYARYPWFRRDFVAPADFGEIETIHVRGKT